MPRGHYEGVTPEGIALQDLAGADGLVAAALRELAEKDALRRMWAKDPALWKPNPTQQQEIVDRLGWLELPESMQMHLADLRAFAQQARDEGVQHVVLCGMGGSSLAPEVFRLTFGCAAGAAALIVLDSTDPGAVANVDAQIDPRTTLFLISSKSGGTIEVMSFLAHFWELAGGDGSRFLAVTDPGTSLEKLGRERGFRQVFLNPPDIGGRYSALSLFGLVPAALIGVDVERLLASAGEERARSSAATAVEASPAAWLGAYMGALARDGRDKLTLLASPGIGSFGLWAEQLIAESTGKEGTGIVPVADEPRVAVERYGADRAFVALRLAGDDNTALDEQVAALRGKHPVLVMPLRDPYGLALQMYRWEIATALAGVLLQINPFDQPNVQESKENTGRVLREVAASHDAAHAAGHGHEHGVPHPRGVPYALGSPGAVAGFVGRARAGDYVALQAYLTPTAQIEAALQRLRAAILEKRGVATTLGFGPRFLHSTGQLHKGGPPRGVFLQLTYSPKQDVPVPGQPYSFATLLAAQASGDALSFASRGLRIMVAGLDDDVLGGLEQLIRAVQSLPA